MKLRSVLPVVIFLFAGLSLHAQRWWDRTQIVTTDFNTCLHGVKNVRNQWVIQPLYEIIQPDPRGYIVSQNGQWGVIDTNGREILKPAYDHVEQLFANYRYSSARHPGGYYSVLLNGKHGVIDSSGRVVVPVRFEEIAGYNDHTIGVREGVDTWHFYHLSGAHFTAPWKTKYWPVMILPHRYSIGTKTRFGKHRAGLVGDSGQVILPQEYDYIDGYSGTDVVMAGDRKKYGYCSRAGKFIWPMTFPYAWGHDFYWYNHTLTGQLGVGPAWNGNKWGMINMKGDTVLPFVYDAMKPFDKYPTYRASGHLWQITKDGLSGVFDDHGGWKIPVSCDSMNTVGVFFADGDSASVGVMLYRMNGHWGVSTTAGQEIFPCTFDEICSAGENEFILRKGDSLYFLGVMQNSYVYNLREQANSNYISFHHSSYGQARQKLVPANRQFSVFEGRDHVRVYYHPGHTHDSIVSYDTTQLIDKGNYYSFSVPDSIIVAGCFYVQALTVPVLQNNGVIGYSLDYLIVRAKSGQETDLLYIGTNKGRKAGLIERNYVYRDPSYFITDNGDVVHASGRVIVSSDSVDTVWKAHHGADGSLYFHCVKRDGSYASFDTMGVFLPVQYGKSFPGDHSDRYHWKRENDDFSDWELFDNRSGRKVLPAKDMSDDATPIWDSITIITNRKSGCRLYNIDRRRYLTQNGYNFIEALTPNGAAFLVKTCSGKMGVMRADGTWLSDTVWTGCTPFGHNTVFRTSWSSDFGYREYLSYYPKYVFSNRTGSALYSTSTGTFIPTDSSWKEIWNYCAEVQYWKLDNRSNYQNSWSSDQDDFIRPRFCVYREDTTKLLDWHRKCIADSLYGGLRYIEMKLMYEDSTPLEYYDLEDENRNCRYCADRGRIYQPFYRIAPGCQGPYAASFVSDSVLSFSKFYLNYRSEGVTRHWCSNVFLFPDGPRSMTLDSLFNPGSGWQQFIINTVMNFLNTHDDIYGDCHNPAGLPFLLRQDWQIAENGIFLYPPNFSEGQHQLAILMSWDQLSPYMRADVMSKLPMKK